MSESAMAKVCGLCGQDCSGRARTKDKSGKYFCKTCYDQAMAKRAGSHSAAPNPSEAGAPPRPSPKVKPLSEPDDQYGLLGALLDEQIAAPPIAATGARECAMCHTPLAPSAVICTHCGFNTASGQQMSVTMAAPAFVGNSRQTAWPILIGLISTLIGGGLGVLQAYGMFLNWTQSNGSPVGGSGDPAYNAGYKVGQSCGGFVPLLMMTWLAWGGIQTMRRDSSGVKNLRRWSIYQTILSTLGLGCGALLCGMAPTIAQRPNFPGDTAEVIATAIGIIVVSGSLLLWALFVFIWMGRAAIQREADSWG